MNTHTHTHTHTRTSTYTHTHTQTRIHTHTHTHAHTLTHTQATFLQPLTASTEALAAANPSLAAMLDTLSNEDLERKCR